MQLQTPISIPESDFKITPQSSGLVIGSCFAGRIAERLEKLRFDIQANPYGVIYNPASILKTLQSLNSNKQYTAADLIFHNELYHSPAHHGVFSQHTSDQTLQNINSIKLKKNPNYLIITLGTAWIYKMDGTVVANCHKLPTTKFTRHRLAFDQIIDSINKMAALFPDAHKIFTVSPIRHTKDGLIENSFSKALLRAAVGELVEKRNDSSYFPAYEIMMDELRDYRFYASDMTHPSDQAAEYIISRFEECYFDNLTTQYVKQLDTILRAASHRPLHPDTQQYKDFKKSNLQQLKTLTKQYPTIDFSDLFSNFA